MRRSATVWQEVVGLIVFILFYSKKIRLLTVCFLVKVILMSGTVMRSGFVFG